MKKLKLFNQPVVKLMSGSFHPNIWYHEKLISFNDFSCESEQQSDYCRRAWRVMIILQGPQGDTSSNLSRLIAENNKMMGRRLQHIDRGYVYEDTYVEQMVKFLDDIINDEIYDLVLFDVNNVKFPEPDEFYRMAKSKGYASFAVEAYDKLNYCVAQNILNSCGNSRLNQTVDIIDDVDLAKLFVEELSYSKTNKKIANFTPSQSIKYMEKDPFKHIPKTIPDFNYNNRESIVDIYDLLWSKKTMRPDRVMIILRGAPGSGKSHLARMIELKEELVGTNRFATASINSYFNEEEHFDTKGRQRCKNELNTFLIDIIEEDLHNLIIIDDENVELKSFDFYHQMGASSGYAICAVELFQSQSFCVQQNINNQSTDEIALAIETFKNNKTPEEIPLINPTRLYDEFECLINPFCEFKIEEMKDFLEEAGS